MAWFRSKSTDPVSDIESRIWRFQRRIGYFLFFCFFVLLVGNLFFPDNLKLSQVTNTFLSIITGWIGIILGFYFSKGMSHNLEMRLGLAANTSVALEKDFEGKSVKMFKELKELQERDVAYKQVIGDQNQIIENLISELEHNNNGKKEAKKVDRHG